MSDQLDGSLQQHLLALLCCSKANGARVGMQLQAEHFDSGVRREIAKAVFAYRSKFKGKPPGRKNLPLLIENLPLQDERLEAARDEGREILRLFKQGFNEEFVAEQGIAFAKRQNFKAGVREAANLVAKPGSTNEEIEQVLYRTLRNQPDVSHPGIALSDRDALAFLDKLEDGYLLGIEPLDKAGIRLAPKTMTLYMGAKNTGKSWGCIHVGHTAVRQDARVLHISLEMSRDQVIKRYFQNWFAIGAQDREYPQAEFITDNYGRVIRTSMGKIRPELLMTDGKIREKLQQRIAKARGLQRLVVADFPTGSLTITQLENYLDSLASHRGFHPDVLIIDYPDLMRVDRRNYRLELGEVYVHLRGLAINRNLALWCPTQVNRSGLDKKNIGGGNVAEDVTKLFTADTVLTYSQTRTERDQGLARLRLEYVRDAPVGMEVAMVQNYGIGQYVCDARLMTTEYMKTIGQDEDGEGDYEELDGRLT